MHEQLMAAIEEGDWKSLISRRMVTVIKTSGYLSDQLAKCSGSCCPIQGWQGASTLPSRNTYKDASGARILGEHANGSVSFQLAQLRVGKDTAPISVVLYIDGSFIKRGIPITVS